MPVVPCRFRSRWCRHFRADPIHTRELRAYAVDEVKRTNGLVSFESAVQSQRRIEPDDTWPESY